MKKQRSRRGFQMAEFAMALMVFFIALFPLINLVYLGCGFCTVFLIAQQTASTGSAQTNFEDTLSSVAQAAKTLTESGLGQWLKLKPVGGYDNSGVDVFVETLSYKQNSGQYHLYGPNASAPLPAQPAEYVYSIKTEATFTVAPFTSLGSFPFIGTIPGVGSPATIRISASRAVEEPEHIVSTNSKLAKTGVASNVSSQTGGWKIPDGTGELWVQQDGNSVISYTVWVPDYQGAATGYLFKVDAQMLGGGGKATVSGRYVTTYSDSTAGYILTGNEFSFNDKSGQTKSMSANPGQNIDSQYEMAYCIGAKQAMTDLMNQLSNDSALSQSAKQASINAVSEAHSWLSNNLPLGWY